MHVRTPFYSWLLLTKFGYVVQESDMMTGVNVDDAEMVQQACRHPHVGVLSYTAAA